MQVYRTPGVYIEEMSGTSPPPIVDIDTAVPAFLGYTEKGPAGPFIRRIASVKDYTDVFGGPTLSACDVVVTPDAITVTGDIQPVFKLYYAICLYFQNGGGPCYVVSLGNYKSRPTPDHVVQALDALTRESEPTLCVLADLAAVGDHKAQVKACADVLGACAARKNCFAILDVPHATPSGSSLGDIKPFRDALTSSEEVLSHGAAYFPDLQTLLPIQFDPDRVKVRTAAGPGGTVTLASLKAGNPSDYGRITAALAEKRVILPPSAAMAGIYATIDGSRGVSSAPSNMPIAGMVGPVLMLSAEDQGNLSIDPASGKSINVIRAFPGQGIRVWGARTLADRSSEWRSVQTRRLVHHIEESIRRGSAFVVFEPNDPSTWLKVKGMIESFLFEQWRQGALLGSSRAEAYDVSVGLGKTMTADDVVNGRLIVEVGLAVLRPGEFIVIRFEHTMQQG